MPTYLKFLTPKILNMYDPILSTLIKMQPHNCQSSRENATPSRGTYRLTYNQEIPPPLPLPVVTVRETNGTYQTQSNNHFLLYRYWSNTKIFTFTKKPYLHRAQWRYCFYLSRVRILVSPWLLKWLANYKRASRSGARHRPVLLKFHSQNGFEMRRRYSYRWLSRWAAKFSHRYFFRAWRTFRTICRSRGKWCWQIHWGRRKCKHSKRDLRLKISPKTFVVEERHEIREIEKIPPTELDSYLSLF